MSGLQSPARAPTRLALPELRGRCCATGQRVPTVRARWNSEAYCNLYDYMISDEELLKVYESAFNRRMVQTDGLALRCHEAGLRAVAALGAQRQRDMEPTYEMLCSGTESDSTDELSDIGADVANIFRAMQRAAPLVTDKP